MFPIEASDVQIFIASQFRALVAYIVFSFFIVLIGIMILIFGRFWFTAGEQIKTAVSFGGAAITTLTTFPLKIVLNCYDKISFLKLAQTKLLELQTLQLSKKEVNTRKEKICNAIQAIIDKPL